ncbi:predicted protein [Methanosarcina acetivorans C2A]|uniref:Uncharacterized protein n=1 Tax=Methanosarcina acetivorans (strain ATCC 35395 / DSM 2834 / JCM 12185 / C2A) TaxID=188937 RepID=Q8TKJ1_METAC|nr:predicted protein [Methanosarcina acetivorans C2A]
MKNKAFYIILEAGSASFEFHFDAAYFLCNKIINYANKEPKDSSRKSIKENKNYHYKYTFGKADRSLCTRHKKNERRKDNSKNQIHKPEDFCHRFVI